MCNEPLSHTHAHTHTQPTAHTLSHTDMLTHSFIHSPTQTHKPRTPAPQCTSVVTYSCTCTNTSCVSVTDGQSWKRLSFLFTSPPASPPPLCLSPTFSPRPQPDLGGSPALWAQPWKEMLSFPRGQILRHRQHSALRKQEGLEGYSVEFDTLPPSLSFSR